MLVWIVYAPTADKLGPDVARMNRVEEVPDELGRVMLGTGEAREPTDEERADWEATREAAEAAEQGDLTKLTKADLLKLAEQRGVQVPPHATKANILDAIEDHDANTLPQVGKLAEDVPLADDAGAADVPAAEQP